MKLYYFTFIYIIPVYIKLKKCNIRKICFFNFFNWHNGYCYFKGVYLGKEVFVKVDMEILKQRDSKGLYSRAEKGEVSNVAGVHFQIQGPENPDLILENNSPKANFSSFAKKILTLIKKNTPDL